MMKPKKRRSVTVYYQVLTKGIGYTSVTRETCGILCGKLPQIFRSILRTFIIDS